MARRGASSPTNRIYTKLRDLTHDLTEEFDIASESSLCGVCRPNEEMRHPGALDDEYLRVQIGEDCPVPLPPRIFIY